MTLGAPAGRILFVAANTSIDRMVEVDRLAVGGINRPDRVVAVPGGKGLNAARAASTLGGRVLVIAIVGGRAGDWIAAGLEAAGIEARLVRVPVESRTCVSVLDRSTGELTDVYEPGGSIDPGEWTALEALIASAGATSVVAMSGSLPRGAPADGYARIVRGARARGAMTIVDTYGTPLRESLAERPTVVKVNADEASDATAIPIAGPSDAAEAARRLRGMGAGAVIVTLGREGAVLAERDGTWLLGPPATVGPYTVGSGDAFQGGMAVALAAGVSLVDAARQGMAAAAANSLTAGAGVLDADDAERALADVHCDRR